jgi:hypothetical protein
MAEALRAGLGVEEFWRLTPRETHAAIEARAWQLEQEGERATELIRLAKKIAGWLAWHTAALQRAKRMPPLQRLIGGGETRKLTPEEAKKRKAEFEELKRIAGNRPRRGERGSSHKDRRESTLSPAQRGQIAEGAGEDPPPLPPPRAGEGSE